jgi:hypothetical protein
MTESSALVKAKDLAPRAFGDAAIDEEMSSKVDDLLYDVHHLLACDTHPVSRLICHLVTVTPVTPSSD